MASKDRVTVPVDGDFEMQALRDRYLVLKGYKEQVETEMDQIKEKVLTRLDEHAVTGLTVAGSMVAYVSRYDRVTLDTAKLKEKHPRIYKMFIKSVTPVASVTIK